MKYCPSCNFTFPDFHHVCNFDGTELVSDPERSLAEVAPRPSLVRRCLMSPSFLAAVGLIAVVSSALLIGYLDALHQTRTTRTDTPANALELAAATNTDLPTKQSSLKRANTHQFKRPRHSTTVATHFARSRREVERPLVARSPSPNPPNYQTQPSPTQSAKAQGSEVALPTKSQPPAREKAKEPVITAMLKSTWRVLKKPFKF